MTKALLLIVQLTILGIGILSLIKGPLSQAPFNEAARVLGPDGKTFWTEDATPMMHQGEYTLEAARAWMKAAAERTGPERIDASREAERLLMISVSYRPNDARAWVMMGIARFDLGDVDGAKVALSEAVRAAPDAPQIAQVRLDLISRMRNSADQWMIAQAKHDLRVLERWNGGGVYRAKIMQDRYLRLIDRQSRRKHEGGS